MKKIVERALKNKSISFLAFNKLKPELQTYLQLMNIDIGYVKLLEQSIEDGFFPIKYYSGLTEEQQDRLESEDIFVGSKKEFIKDQNDEYYYMQLMDGHDD